ncbi:MAG: hypothetical protein ABR987_17135, partial [Terracidiphilus sp.]
MKISFPARFFRRQIPFLATSAVVVAIFWADGERINPVEVLAYALCIGNLLTPSINRLDFLWQRPFPYNLLIFLPALLGLTIPVYLISSAVVWLVTPPYSQALST